MYFFRYLPILVIILFSSKVSYGQTDQNSIIPLDDIRQSIKDRIIETDEVFHWKDANDQQVWSALLASDSLLSIGYQPIGFENIHQKMHLIDTQSDEWTTARTTLIDYIVSRIEQKHGPRFDRSYLMPFGEEQALPYINIRVFDLDIVTEIRQMEQVRYADVMTFSMEEQSETEYRDGVGCTDYNGNPNPADYISITPQSRQSWHIAEHNIDQAWLNSNQGQGIWIAVIDSGSSATQDKLNSEFTEGQSSGRTIENYGFFNNDGWQDDCGHGTAMAGLAAAPRGFDDTPAGVAYKANLMTFRGTDDVFLDEAAEKIGVSASLNAAGADPRVHIISMSLGDIISNGQISDAVIFAEGQGKLIFAAAGTSSSFTSWYPVIFPAWMPETVACTGITDGSPRERCSNCHDGAEVDFVVCMEKTSNGNNGITIGIPDNSQDYVGGSSAATAITAGQAALVWGNHPTWSKDQVLNRMIQSADYFPNRDGDFGWGKIDVNAAVAPSSYVACSSATNNDVFIEITNISFPAFAEGFGSDNEWVVEINGEAHYFRVDENGDSGNPATFIDVSVCGDVPMIFNLGQTSCGQSSLILNIETHENDSASDNCDFSDNGFFGNSDDALTNENISVDFNNNTFVHNNVEGPFVFTYSAYCSSNAVPLVATINGPSSLCQNEPTQDIIFLGTGGVAPYTISYTVNGGAIQTINTAGNTATLTQSTSMQGTFTYQLIDIVDANGCTQTQSGNITVDIYPTFTPTAFNNSPACAAAPVTITATPTGAPEYIFFIDANNNGMYDVGEELQAGTSDTYTGTTFNDGDVVFVLVTNTDGCRFLANTTITILPSNDPACTPCPGNYAILGAEAGIADYETDGTIQSNQIILNGAVVDYDSGICISLDPGFEVQVGAIFEAFIDGCNGGLGGSNLNINSEQK